MTTAPKPAARERLETARPVRRVPILLALPEGEEGDALSAAFDALAAAGVEHESLPPGGLEDAQRRTLSRHLAAALECLEIGRTEDAAALLRETLDRLAPAPAPEEPTP
ncbi:hypothetical protein KGQ90_16390 [Modicisalibacter tunisiensis]|uniref:hypothetical protein n=1 Tax=Modicisalibacter tunisiensis TaxID=390637 RepID=UPI001CCBE410|nr:hypothetical protein [Modicisalibacter tunisiensis]MBZ9540499.1 hypothetical protein [Modicisalibacter tunisiensis]